VPGDEAIQRDAHEVRPDEAEQGVRHHEPDHDAELHAEGTQERDESLQRDAGVARLLDLAHAARAHGLHGRPRAVRAGATLGRHSALSLSAATGATPAPSCDS
jgi:hypothetical protein